MEQRSAMDEEDMFYERDIQEQTDIGADDMYISLVQNIAVKKCRISQKKQKIKLLIQDVKKLINDLNTANAESEKLAKEKEEMAHQQNLKLMNLKGVKESRASLETVLSNLMNKVAIVEKETKEQKDTFNAAIQHATEKWESYKEIYEEFPLARKRKEMIVQLKKIDIELRQTKLDFEDLKYKEKLKTEITEKRNRIYAVKLAKAYFTREEKLAERDALLNKINELKLQLESMKSDNFTEDQRVPPKRTLSALPKPQTQKTAKPPLLQFKMPPFLVSSPPLPVTADEPKTPGYFNWQTLFSSSLLGGLRRDQIKQVEVTGKSSSLPDKFTPQSLTRDNMSPDVQTGPASNDVDKICVNNALTRRVTNEDNNSDLTLGKRKDCFQTDHSIGNQQPLKKVRFIQNEQSDADKENDILQGNVNKNHDISKNVNKEVHCESERKPDNKKFVKDDKIATSSKTESIMSMLYSNKKLSTSKSMLLSKGSLMMSQNLKSVSSMKPSGTQQNVSERYLDSVISKAPLESFNSQKGQLLKQMSVNQPKDSLEDEYKKNLPDNYSMSMTPTPPDVIPVESNSQPESGTNNFMTSDFTSPSDLDEMAKLHYQQISIESPEFVYPKGPELAKTQQSGPEVSEVVRSKYFSSGLPLNTTQSQDLNQTISPEGEYHLPYSPPGTGEPGVNSPLSPPSGDLGYFGFGEKTPAKQLFDQSASPDGNKSPDGQFGFSFMSKPQKKSSLFSLF